MEAAQSRSVPSFRGKVTGIKMLTVTTPRAFFKRYAAASYFDPTIGGATVFLGFRKSYWHVLSYGSSDVVGCGYPQRLLGAEGRRSWRISVWTAPSSDLRGLTGKPSACCWLGLV